MKFRKISLPALALLCAGVTMHGVSNAAVTVLGWPGGTEETALRATVEAYNAKPDISDADKVQLLFFNREGFYDKLQADMAAGSDAFDVNLVATYSIGRYAPYMEPIDLDQDAAKTFGDAVLKTMQYDGKQYGVPTDLSLHFMYYRKDLIDALMKDDAAKAKYAEKYRRSISARNCSPRIQTAGPGTTGRRQRYTSASR